MQPRRFEQDMDDELRFHLEMQIEENIAAGMDPEDARSAAVRAFGGVEQTKETCREVYAWGWLEGVVQDLRFAGRLLYKQPGFTCVIVLTLALGIGANTAIFSVVNAVLLRPLPFPEPDRLVMLWESNPATALENEQVSAGNIADWRRQSQSLETVGYLYNKGPWSRNFLLKAADRSVRLRGRYVSSSFFELFGVAPHIGRIFLTDEDEPGGKHAAVLSYGLWQRKFGGDPSVLGSTLHVADGFTIVGVMPPDFRLPQDAEVWFSWSSADFLRRSMNVRDGHGLWTFARLKPGVKAADAQSELTAIQARIAEAHPQATRIARQVKVVPLFEQMIGSSARPALLVLLGAVAFVLLIACANVANLLLARAGARHKEIAIRTALGAGRMRVVRQLLTESVLLAVCGGALGILLATWGVQVLGAMTTDDTYRGVREFRIDRVAEVSLDGSVLIFTLAISIATGVVFGLAPALQCAKVHVNEALKQEGRGSSAGAGRQRLHDALLVSQVAVALVLLVGAGVMLQSFLRMQQRDPGVLTDGVVKFEVDLDVAVQKYPGEIRDVTHKLMERIRALPGVAAAGAAGEIPLIKSGWPEPLLIEGEPVASDRKRPIAHLRIVTPDLFRAMGAPLLQGRDLRESDIQRSPRVCLVNDTLARRIFPDGKAIGQRIATRVPRDWMEIVGVVGDIRNFGQDSDPEPEIYPCYRQHFWGGAELGPTFAVRATIPGPSVIAAIRHALEGDGQGAPIVGKVQTLEDILRSSVAEERLRSTLLVLFATAALVLAIIGIYGVMSWNVNMRIHEIGIRMALGAEPIAVLRMIAGKGLKLTLCGVAIGLLGAIAVTRILANQLYGVTSIEPFAMIGIPLLLTAIAMIACYLPARRATRIDPVIALRHE